MPLQAYSIADIDAASTAAEPPEAPRFASKLAEWAAAAWAAAVMHRDREFTERMLKCRRQASGVYEPDVLKRIQDRGGSSAYYNLTATKASAAESWLRDTMMPLNDKAWELTVPTPVPSLPQSLQALATDAVVQRFALEPQAPTREEVMQFTQDMAEQLERMYMDQARDRVRDAEKKMFDLLDEGGFYPALIEFIVHLCIYPVAWLKGPVIRSTRRIVWGDRGEFAVKDEMIPTWTSPHPMDMYPCPNARTPNDGYMCERVRFTRAQLARMRGQDGWNTEELDYVLAPPATDQTVGASLQGESERADAELRDTSISGGVTGDQVEGVEIWGCVQGQMLIDWGGDKMPWLAKAKGDPLGYQDVNVVLVGDRVVKAVLNPDPVGDTPYSVSSFFPRPGSLYGEALPERMRDCQDTINATARALQNNAALASGPLVVVDLDSLEPGQKPDKLKPWAMFQFRSLQVPGKSPFTFHDIPMRTRDLLEMIEH